MLRQILVISLTLLLTCCAVNDQKNVSINKPKEADVEEIKSWTIDGRLLISADEVLTTNLNWRHTRVMDNLKLAGVLGLGAITIKLNETGIVIDKGYGKPLYSANVNEFIAQQLGFVVPITALRRWVVGKPLNGIPVIQLKDGFEQLGWQVTYNKFVETQVGWMPYKLKITKDRIKLKLVVDKWEIE